MTMMNDAVAEALAVLQQELTLLAAVPQMTRQHARRLRDLTRAAYTAHRCLHDYLEHTDV